MPGYIKSALVWASLGLVSLSSACDMIPKDPDSPDEYSSGVPLSDSVGFVQIRKVNDSVTDYSGLCQSRDGVLTFGASVMVDKHGHDYKTHPFILDEHCDIVGAYRFPTEDECDGEEWSIAGDFMPWQLIIRRLDWANYFSPSKAHDVKEVELLFNYGASEHIPGRDDCQCTEAYNGQQNPEMGKFENAASWYHCSCPFKKDGSDL